MTSRAVLVAANRRILKNAFYSGVKYCRTMSEEELYACDFEVFGHVQGVFFRKFTVNQAKSLGIKGWVMNTASGSVKGQLEGPANKVDEMKKWLEFTGSPSSKIDKAVFAPLTRIKVHKFKSFTIKE